MVDSQQDAIGVADARREDRLDRHRRAGGIEPRAEHLEPARRLPGTSEHGDGEQVELSVGGERLLVGDLDERDLLALVLRDAERVVDGARLLDHVRCRQQREAHPDHDGDAECGPADALAPGAALRARRRVVVEEGHP